MAGWQTVTDRLNRLEQSDIDIASWLEVMSSCVNWFMRELKAYHFGRKIQVQMYWKHSLRHEQNIRYFEIMIRLMYTVRDHHTTLCLVEEWYPITWGVQAFNYTKEHSHSLQPELRLEDSRVSKILCWWISRLLCGEIHLKSHVCMQTTANSASALNLQKLKWFCRILLYFLFLFGLEFWVRLEFWVEFWGLPIPLSLYINLCICHLHLASHAATALHVILKLSEERAIDCRRILKAKVMTHAPALNHSSTADVAVVVSFGTVIFLWKY